MAGADVAQRAADELIARKDELALAITRALYEESPYLVEKYGERGRTKCLEDMRYNLEHMAPAIALEEPALFARYVTWLREMLTARGVDPGEVRRSLQLTSEIARELLTPDVARRVETTVAAGLASLAAAGSG